MLVGARGLSDYQLTAEGRFASESESFTPCVASAMVLGEQAGLRLLCGSPESPGPLPLAAPNWEELLIVRSDILLTKWVPVPT